MCNPFLDLGKYHNLLHQIALLFGQSFVTKYIKKKEIIRDVVITNNTNNGLQLIKIKPTKRPKHKHRTIEISDDTLFT
jgi:hypothetical protein